MNTKFSTLFAAIFLLNSSGVQAYPEYAHVIMTGLAYDKSVLADDEFLRSIGIVDETRETTLLDTEDVPYEITPNQLHNVRRLVRFGALEEDAVHPPRMLNHFSDIQNGNAPYSALDSIGGYLVEPSPSPVWSLEPNGDIENWIALYDQDLSYKDALKNYVEGVTTPDEAERSKKMGLVFQTMGHLTHHMQDMGQPEHVRDDNHFDSGHGVLNGVLIGTEIVTAVSPSLFENTVYDRLSLVTAAEENNPYPSIDIRQFSEPSELWSRGAVDGLSNKGIGAFTSRNYISQDTNFNFVQGQIFNGTAVNVTAFSEQPLPGSGQYSVQAIPGTFYADNFPPGYAFFQRYYLGNQVVDHYDNSQSFYNELTANLGLVALSNSAVYSGGLSVDTVTIENQVATLVPRAISYSTAMIDFFFRGRFSVVQSKPITNKTGVITLRNLSGAQYVDDGNGAAFELTNGTFRLFVEDTEGTRREVDVSSPAASISFNEQFELNYDLSILDNDGFFDTKDAVKFIVLYEGDIGQYQAVASVEIPRLGTLMLAEFNPLFSTGKQLAREGSYSELDWYSRYSEFGTFNIDWKGRYITDSLTGLKTPSRSISFSGPSARFFGSEGYRNDILVDGRFLYRTPGPVLGAAMRTDANGQEYVMAIVHSTITQTQRLLRKPFMAASNFSRLVVPLPAAGAAPESLSGQADWELLATLPFGKDYPVVGGEQIVAPWFFSGDGSKASTLRDKRIIRTFDSNRCGDQTVYTCEDVNSGFPAGDYEVSVLNRYEITITDVGATVADQGYEVGDKAELAVDYDDDELLILNTRNLPYTTLAADSNWLYVNDEPLLDRSIYDCEHPEFAPNGGDKLACRPVADTALAPTGFPGLHTRWIGTPDGTFEGLATSLHISYIDLRTRTFEYTKAISDPDVLANAGESSEGRVEYWISHDGQKELLYEEDSGTVICVADNYIYMSPYGSPAFPANYFDLNPIPPVRGQYTLQSNCSTVAPINEKMVRGVDRYKTYFASGQNGSDSSYYNYISTGDNLSQFGIQNTQVGTPVKVIVR